MPKSLPILPHQVRAPGTVEFEPIPINQYSTGFDQEVIRYGKSGMLRLHRDMVYIRVFENMLNDIKLKGSWMGLEYSHRGPAHLSIGQEASAVGQAYLLGPDDLIFGSHRSHGEILAKGLSAIEKMEEASLEATMRSYNGGRTLRAVQHGRHDTGDVRSLAIDFLLYGALAEIFGRDAGFNRGMGGSMHAFFTPFGIYPNNAIVGGSADISVGAALYKRVNNESGLVICNIGDAAASCGPTWEAMSFATMDQFNHLWDDAHRGGLPLIMNFVNNFYGMGGQPVGETGGLGVLARIGAGLAQNQMHAERVDGYNPLAVVDAIARKRTVLADGGGPVLLDTVTYRYSGHSPSDASSYRDKAEIDAWRESDSISWFAHTLIEHDVATPEELIDMERAIEQRILEALKRAADDTISPRANLMVNGNLLEQTMFCNRDKAIDESRPAETLLTHDENPRVAQLAGRSRGGIGEDGELLPKGRCIAVRDALFEAILDRFHADPELIAYGEENRDWGGAFAVYRGLTETLPYHRLFNSPISEAAIVGTAVGYALCGGTALIELMYCDFLGRAGDEVFNQLSKWQAMSGGMLTMPVVLRVSVGSKYGAQHSQDWTALCAHVPGLKVVFPATPYDAKGLMAEALAGSDPVIFFESQRTYDQPELFHKGGVPVESYRVPIGVPDVKRNGTDLTILTVGATLYRAIEAADRLHKEFGIAAEIVDARSLVPFDYAVLVESVKKTGRLLLASDACERGSVLHTIAATVTQIAFDYLDCPPVVLGARNWITPPDELEEAFFPFPSDFLDAIHTQIVPLDGYTPVRPCGPEEILRRAKMGV